MGLPNDDYYATLGRFIHRFSEAETCIHAAFAKFAKLDPKVASLLRKDKVSQVSANIRDLVALNGFDPELVADVVACLDQFAAISSFRHEQVHRNTSLTEDGTYETTNLATIKSIEGLEISRFTVRDLHDASTDLARLTLRLVYCAEDYKGNLLTAHQKRVLYSAWRYKRVEPDRPHQPRPKVAGESKAQRKASQKLLAGRTKPVRDPRRA